MSYCVTWSKQAAKQLLKLPKRERLIILAWVSEHLDGCENPRAVQNGKALVGVKDGYRWRIGTYRVLAHIKDEEIEIEVFKVGHRRDVYRNLQR